MTRAWWGVSPPIAFVGCLALLGARFPEAILRAEFWAEDGLFYSDALRDGVATIVDPYAGYLIVGLRAIAWVESLGPPLMAPAIGNSIALATMAGVAAFAASARMPWRRGTGVLLAILVVLAPIGFELVGSVVHIVWPLTLWIGLVAVSRPPQSVRGRRLEVGGLVGAGVTGIGSLLALPLFFRGPRYRLVTVAIVALLQLLVLALASSERSSGIEVRIEQVPYVWLLRGVVTPIVGDRIAEALPAVAVVSLAATITLVALVLLLRLSPRVAVLTLFLIVVIPFAGIVAGSERTDLLLNPAWAPRYFWSASIGFALLLALNHRRLIAVPLFALFLVGAAVEFRIQPATTQGWAAKSSCIGGDKPCEIPVAPGEKWNVRWAPPE